MSKISLAIIFIDIHMHTFLLSESIRLKGSFLSVTSASRLSSDCFSSCDLTSPGIVFKCDLQAPGEDHYTGNTLSQCVPSAEPCSLQVAGLCWHQPSELICYGVYFCSDRREPHLENARPIIIFITNLARGYKKSLLSNS